MRLLYSLFLKASEVYCATVLAVTAIGYYFWWMGNLKFLKFSDSMFIITFH